MNIDEKIDKYLISEGKYSESNFDAYMKKYKAQARKFKNLAAFKTEVMKNHSSPVKVLDVIENHVKDSYRDKNHDRMMKDLYDVLKGDVEIEM